jgi:hypothetical protein
MGRSPKPSTALNPKPFPVLPSAWGGGGEYGVVDEVREGQDAVGCADWYAAKP